MLTGGWWAQNAYQTGGAVLLGSWVFWIVFSIVMHELAHGWTAIRHGDRTPIDLGHMTWNPVVHMGPWSLAALALIGIAWGAMPVDPSRLRGRHADALVSAAGPLMNVGLALGCAVLSALWIGVGGGVWFSMIDVPDRIYANVEVFLTIGCVLNIVLAVFNMMPVPPLDGSRILARYCPPYARFLDTELGQFAGFAGFALLFFFAGPTIAHVGFGIGRWLMELWRSAILG